MIVPVVVLGPVKLVVPVFCFTNDTDPASTPAKVGLEVELEINVAGVALVTVPARPASVFNDNSCPIA